MAKPKTWQHSNLHKEDLNAWCTKVTVLFWGRETPQSFVDIFLLPSSLLISSNLPAQPLRQQHFCMEQQLRHLCEGRPFDVDNTQKCSLPRQVARGRERGYEEELEKERENERNKDSCSPTAFVTKWKPRLAALRHYALLFLCITFAKYIQLPRRRRRRWHVIYGRARLHPSFGMSMLSQWWCWVRGRQGETYRQSRPGPLLVCDQK